MIIQLCGLSGAGKTTLAKAVEKKLTSQRFSVEVLDGDEYRQTLCKGLGFSKKDRLENVRRMGFVARQLSKHGIIAIICAINPYEEMRAEIRKNYPNVKTIHVDCPIATLRKRDTKGLYRKAFLPEGHPEKLTNLSGVNDQFDKPGKPDLYLDTSKLSIIECMEQLVQFIKSSFTLPVRALQAVNIHNSNIQGKIARG